jgi:hypothetical protein
MKEAQQMLLNSNIKIIEMAELNIQEGQEYYNIVVIKKA